MKKCELFVLEKILLLSAQSRQRLDKGKIKMHHSKPTLRVYTKVSAATRKAILRMRSKASVSDIAREVNTPRSTVAAVTLRRGRCTLNRTALAVAVREAVIAIGRTRRKKGERRNATAALVLERLSKAWKGRCTIRTLQRVMRDFCLYDPVYNYSLRAAWPPPPPPPPLP
jgi:IS30 family transposase